MLVCKKRDKTLEIIEADGKFDKIENGEMLFVEYGRKHSWQQHKAVFAIAETVLMNMPDSSEWSRMYMINPNQARYNFVKAVEWDLGFFELMPNIDGTWRREAKSLKMHEMGHDEFNEFFKKYVDYCAKILQCEPEDLINGSQHI